MKGWDAASRAPSARGTAMVRALLAGLAVAAGLAAAPGTARANSTFFFATPGARVVVVPQQHVFTSPPRPVMGVPRVPVLVAPRQPVFIAPPPAIFVDPFCCAVPQFRGATGLGGPGRSGWVR